MAAMTIDCPRLTEAIARVAHYEADVWAASQRALAPPFWLATFREAAEQVVFNLADKAHLRFIKDFVYAITAVIFNGELVTQINPPQFSQMAAQPNLPGSGAPQYDKLEVKRGGWREFLAEVTEWVETEKRWDLERDGEKIRPNILEKADWLAHLMVNPNPTPEEGQARDALLPHIVEFIQRQHLQDRLPAEVVDVWLRAVIRAWRPLVADIFPHRFQAELAALRSQQLKLL